jgi:acyl-CoA thioester hydrolase
MADLTTAVSAVAPARHVAHYAGDVAPLVIVRRDRIVMSEVDVAQIHFTTLFRWMDRGLTEWLAQADHPFTRILEEGPGIPVVDANVSISERLLLDDEVEIRSYVGGIGTTSFRSLHVFRRDGKIAATGRIVHVCVDRVTREPVPVPDWIRERAADGEDEPSP